MAKPEKTAKLVALYKQPEDPKAFDDQYFNTHAPLARQMPFLRHFEVHRFTGTPMGGEAPYYMIAELHYDSMDELKQSMSSPEGMAAAKNLMGFAGKIVTMMLAEDEVKEGAC